MITTITAEQSAELTKMRIDELHKDIVSQNYTIAFNTTINEWEWRTKTSKRLMGKSKYSTALIIMCRKSEALIAETGNTPR